MSALKEIQSIIREQGDASKCVELNLSQIKIGRFTPEIKQAIQKCKNLEILILTDCGLQSLDNMPKLDLTAIDLTANKLRDGELVKLTNYQNLGQLILNQNNIQKLESVKVLQKLQNLQELDLSDNKVTEEDKYREFVFENLKKLEILDRFDRQGNQQLEQEEFVDDDEDDDDEEFDDDQDDDDQEDFDEDQSQSPPPKAKGSEGSKKRK